MAHQRHNPSALRDPKVSIVIPVYNEKSTIDEILRRVLDTEVRKEVIIIDDCSTDGTRQILENMAASRTDLDSNRRLRQRSQSTSGASTKCR
jgi:glycosyltransferase involved in cell wall biosynthesis